MGFVIAFSCFFLDGLLSVYQGPKLFDIISFKPMFTIVSLVLIYSYFTKYPKDYFKTCLILGLLYDFIYTNTLILNTLMFPLLGYIIYRLYEIGSDSIVSGIVINAIILALYHAATYIILALIGYLPLNVYLFSDNFLGILITNTIFLIIIYSLINILSRRKRKQVMFGR